MPHLELHAVWCRVRNRPGCISHVLRGAQVGWRLHQAARKQHPLGNICCPGQIGCLQAGRQDGHLRQRAALRLGLVPGGLVVAQDDAQRQLLGRLRLLMAVWLACSCSTCSSCVWWSCAVHGTQSRLRCLDVLIAWQLQSTAAGGSRLAHKKSWQLPGPEHDAGHAAAALVQFQQYMLDGTVLAILTTEGEAPSAGMIAIAAVAALWAAAATAAAAPASCTVTTSAATK